MEAVQWGAIQSVQLGEIGAIGFNGSSRCKGSSVLQWNQLGAIETVWSKESSRVQRRQ